MIHNAVWLEGPHLESIDHFCGYTPELNRQWIIYSRLAIVGFWRCRGNAKEVKRDNKMGPIVPSVFTKKMIQRSWCLKAADEWEGSRGLRASPLPRFCLSWKWIVGPLSTQVGCLKVNDLESQDPVEMVDLGGNWYILDSKNLWDTSNLVVHTGIGRRKSNVSSFARCVIPFGRGDGWWERGWVGWEVLSGSFSNGFDMLLSLFAFHACWSQKVQELLGASFSWRSSQSTHSWASLGELVWRLPSDVCPQRPLTTVAVSKFKRNQWIEWNGWLVLGVPFLISGFIVSLQRAFARHPKMQLNMCLVVQW